MYPTTTIYGSFIQHQRYDMNVNDKIVRLLVELESMDSLF